MILDTYAWVELFLGSEKGKKVKDVLESEFCYASIVTLAEITKWCLQNDLDVPKYIGAIQKAAAILNLNNAICILAGKITFDAKKTARSFGLIGGVIAATAELYNLRVLTGDEHFRSFGAEML